MKSARVGMITLTIALAGFGAVSQYGRRPKITLTV